MEVFYTGILFLIAGGFFSLFCPEKVKVKFVSIFSCLASLIILFSVNSDTSTSFMLFPFGEITFALDDLSKFFVVVISVITALASVYAVGYTEPYLNKGKKIASHCFFFPLLTAAMLSLTVVQNIFAFLIIWEIMSLASFFLVIFEDDKKEVLSAGIKYLIYMHISVIFIIAAFVLMSIGANGYSFQDIQYMFAHNPNLRDVIFILAFIGFGTKAGFVPMHNWLPDAHPAAPSHVSAVMSAVMIKTGIYGILRVIWLMGEPTKLMAYFVLIISVITALYGIIYAVNQKDVKKLLAYSSVENIGLIGIAISIILFGRIYAFDTVTVIGTAACFLHILNHSIFKSLLFMGAGSVYLKTHTKNMELLGGLVKKMPCTAVCFLFGCVAVCAFPPLNGFIGEFLMYAGLMNLLKVHGSTLFITVILSIAALAFVGTLVILAMSKVYSVIFSGNPRSTHSQNVSGDVPKTMLVPMGISATLTLLTGIASPFVLSVVPFGMFTEVIAIRDVFYLVYVLMTVSVIVLSFVILVLILYFVGKLLTKNSDEYEVWGCGYDKGNNHIQYTASSYVSPFTSILTPLFKKIFDVKKPKGIFPKDAHYSSEVEDVEEAYIINPVLKFDEKFLSKFERLQDGNIQHYILYGLIFLILLLAGVVFFG